MRKFFKTVAVVTFFSVCEKFLGFLYRIYLSRTIGAEGVGIYQVALSVFAFLLTVICSGTPITVSRLISKYRSENAHEKVQKIISSALVLTFALSVIVVAACFILGDGISFLFADERCKSIFFIVLPGLIFNSVYAVLRGVFWGNKDFTPYSVIELLEEITMIIVGIILVTAAGTVTEGAISAGTAVLVSYILSFTLASIVFFVRRNRLKNPLPEMKTVLFSSAPVTAMRTVNSLAVSLISVILPLRLVSAGYTEAQSMSLFGAAAGQAIPLLFVPSTLIGSFTLVLIPEISENFYRKNDFAMRNDVERALKFTAIVSCVFIPLFTVCGEEIGILIFDSYECGKYLTASAFLVPFMGLSGITTSILNSIGCEVRTLTYCIVSGVFMLLSIWFLPQFTGIYSLLIGFSFVYVLTTVLNIRLIYKKCAVKPVFMKYFSEVFLVTLPPIALGLIFERFTLKIVGTFLCFLITAAIVCIFYAILCVCTGLFSAEIIKSKLKFKFKKKKVKVKAV